MKSLEELKKEVFDKLSQFPKLEAFFKDSLEERMKVDDYWTENALVHCALVGISEDHPLLVLINSIYDDEENFGILKKKLTPKDDYDRKMHDVLAELNGYHQLKESGFDAIEAIQKDIDQKRPDFSAELDGKPYLFEVKNMRSPIDLFNILLDKYYARKLICPDIYSKVFIHFKASTTWRDVRFNPREPDELYHKTDGWLATTFQTIESADVKSMDLQPFEAMFKGEKMRIRCLLEKGKSLGMIFGFDRGLYLSDPVNRKNLLYPFAKKIIAKVGEGMDQLLEFGSSNDSKKCVLINWQKSGDLPMFFNKECVAIVEKVDHLIKNISENLFVRLLNHHTLP